MRSDKIIGSSTRTRSPEDGIPYDLKILQTPEPVSANCEIGFATVDLAVNPPILAENAQKVLRNRTD